MFEWFKVDKVSGYQVFRLPREVLLGKAVCQNALPRPQYAGKVVEKAK